MSPTGHFEALGELEGPWGPGGGQGKELPVGRWGGEQVRHGGLWNQFFLPLARAFTLLPCW